MELVEGSVEAAEVEVGEVDEVVVAFVAGEAVVAVGAILLKCA